MNATPNVQAWADEPHINVGRMRCIPGSSIANRYINSPHKYDSI